MVPTHEFRVDEAKKQVELSWTVKNEGDENAKEVALDLPQLNESYSLLKDMPPGSVAKQAISIPFERLGISEKGQYALIYRILYKDANFYPFSAPYVALVTLPPAPSRALMIQFDDGQEGAAFELTSSVRISFSISNRSSAPVKLTGIDPVFATETPTRLLEKPELGELQPGASVKAELEVQRQGALTGSVYFVGVVVSGVSQGGGEAKHFAQQADMRVSVRDSSFNPRNAMGALIALISVGLISFWIFQKARQQKAGRA